MTDLWIEDVLQRMRISTEEAKSIAMMIDSYLFASGDNKITKVVSGFERSTREMVIAVLE